MSINHEEFIGYEKGKKSPTILTNEEATFLRTMAREWPGEGIILEIGTGLGKSTVHLALGSKEVNRGNIYTIDINEYPETKLNFNKFNVQDWIIPIKGVSWEISASWDTPIRLFYIDGSHKYEDVTKDYKSFYPFIVEGGIIIFHDIGETRVRKAVNNFSKSVKLIGSKNIDLNLSPLRFNSIGEYNWFNMGWIIK